MASRAVFRVPPNATPQENKALPVEPHEAVAEVSRIGNV